MHPSGAGPHTGVCGESRGPRLPHLLLLVQLRPALARSFSPSLTRALPVRRASWGGRAGPHDGAGILVTLSQSRREAGLTPDVFTLRVKHFFTKYSKVSLKVQQ